MDALRGSDEGLLRAADLAAREDFRLGVATISPGTRSVSGPGGATNVEPRVMQVLVVLAESAGQVVTRDRLFDRCWGGTYVGDDSLNRVIGAVRKLASEIANSSFVVETVPRTGYKLTVAHGTMPRAKGWSRRKGIGMSRRAALTAGGALATLGAAGFWWRARSQSDVRFETLLQQVEDALRRGPDDRTAKLLQEAVSIRPQSAKAWGLLAIVTFVLAQGADPKVASARVKQAESAARRALSINAKEPNALLAMFELQGSTLELATRDQRLRQIISVDPANLMAIGELVLLLQAAGLNRESWNWNERALAAEPLSVEFLCKRALKLWIAGRVSQADKVIDQVRALYPSNPWPWWIRFMILALTERPRAASAMLESSPAMISSPTEAAFWRPCLAALDQRSPQSIALARRACSDGARKSGDLAGQGVMILSALGEVDAAFDVTNGFLLSRGSVVRQDNGDPRQVTDDAAYRINTQWLFTPPAALMRADPRFLSLCDDLGLTDYWRKRGVKPDYLLT